MFDYLKIFAKSAKEQIKGGIKGAGEDPSANDLANAGTKYGDLINTIFAAIGVAAVVMIIIGGIGLILSGGDPGKVKKGKATILWSVVGLVLCLISWSIVSLVLENI